MRDFTITDFEKFNATAELYNARFGTWIDSATVAEYYLTERGVDLNARTVDEMAGDIAEWSGREW